MIGDKRVLAVIPARAGSKRLPGKNTLPLAGKPLIQWTIEAAQGCPEIDAIAVTTDDLTAVAIARRMCVDVIHRPPEMATDDAPTAPALRHALIRMEAIHERTFDLVVLLQPTSPLRRPEHISQGFRELDASSGFSGCYSAWTAGPDGQPNGAVYISRRQVVMAGQVKSQLSCAYTIDARYTVDIDTAEDFARAVALMEDV